MNNLTIKLELNVAEVNVILEGLGKLPFEKSSLVHNYIFTESNKQLDQLQKSAVPIKETQKKEESNESKS